MTEFKHILFERAGTTARITLNRPDKRNALTYAMLAELNAALWEADNDAAVHAVVICGAGKHFCAGYDISPDYRRYPKLGEVDGRQYREREYFTVVDDDIWTLQRVQSLYIALFDMSKPVIAEVQGYCLAGGTDLALLCDLIIAGDSAAFGYPPTRDMGSPPSNMWLYHLGPQWSKRLLLTGDLLDAPDAARLGLILKALPDQLVRAEVDRLCERFGLIDVALLSANKRIVNLGLELMGARTLQRLATENDGRAHQAPSAYRFRELSRRGGLGEAVKARNQAFGSSRARAEGPDEPEPGTASE